MKLNLLIKVFRMDAQAFKALAELKPEDYAYNRGVAHGLSLAATMLRQYRDRENDEQKTKYKARSKK